MQDPTFHHHNGRVADDCDHARLGINDDLRFFCLACHATAPIPEWEAPRVGSLVRVTHDLLKPELAGRVGVVTRCSSGPDWAIFDATLVDDGAILIGLRLITWVEVVLA